jgi:hypothetical protein
MRPESASELYRPRDRLFSAKLGPTFADRGVSAVGMHRADHATPLYLQKWALTSPTSSGMYVYIFEIMVLPAIETH